MQAQVSLKDEHNNIYGIELISCELFHNMAAHYTPKEEASNKGSHGKPGDIAMSMALSKYSKKEVHGAGWQLGKSRQFGVNAAPTHVVRTHTRNFYLRCLKGPLQLIFYYYDYYAHRFFSCYILTLYTDTDISIHLRDMLLL